MKLFTNHDFTTAAVPHAQPSDSTHSRPTKLMMRERTRNCDVAERTGLSRSILLVIYEYAGPLGHNHARCVFQEL